MKDIEAGDSASFLRGVPLGIVEIGGARNHAVSHLITKLCGRVSLELLQDHCGHLFWGEPLLVILEGYDDLWSALLVLDHLEGPATEVFLDSLVVEHGPNHSF